MSPAPVFLLGCSNNTFASGVAESLMAITALLTQGASLDGRWSSVSSSAITRQVRIGSVLRLIIILDLRPAAIISAGDPSISPVDQRGAQYVTAVSCVCAEDQRE